MATIAAASLNARERRMLDRLIGLLEREYGEDLLGVWLYGSRARGEPPGEDSDIDLLVVTSDGQEDDARVSDLVWQVHDEADVPWALIQAAAVSPAAVANRRAVEAFHIREIDRDKIVLWGGEVEAPEGFTWHEPGGPVRQRTREYLAGAHEELRQAELSLEGGLGSGTVHHAYYVGVNAVSAALSEEDRFARTHHGMWVLGDALLVATGKLPAYLHAKARALQPAREKAVYAPPPDQPWIKPTQAEAEAALDTARSYLQAVEALLGV